MKNLIFILTLTILCSCINSAKNFDLPTTWTKDFTISIYDGGGMMYASTKVLLTTDSIVYTEMENGKDDIKKHKITAEDQKQILEKLKRLNVEYFISEGTDYVICDKGTTEICFKINKDKTLCVASGATEEIREKYSKDFYDTFNYLLNFAKNKTK